MLTITPLPALARCNPTPGACRGCRVTLARLPLLLAVVLVALGLGAASASAATNALAWGINASGQLGNGTTTNSSSPVAVSTGSIPAGVSITQTSGGYAHSLARGSDGNVYAWGDNGYGQLGNGTTTSSSAPVAVSAGAIPAGVSITQIAAGGYHSLALGSDGHVYAWGVNASGQLGNGTTINSSAPVAVSAGAIPAGVSITQIAAGDYHSLALGSDGHIYAWGANASGQLGNGTTTNSSAPAAVSAGAIPAGVSITQIAAGGGHSLALGSDGHVYAWGYNGDGELGNGTTTSASAPVSVSAGAVPAGVSITQIAGGSNHSLAVGSDGHAYGWGRNGNGELGNGTTTDSSAPVAVSAGAIPAGVSLTQIAAGDHHSLVRGNDGHAYAWGENTFGQLGDGTTTSSSAPVVVSQPAGSTIGTVGSGPGANHSLALGGAAAGPAGVNITAVEGQSFSGKVAGGLVCALASATISWGDGTTSPGTSDGNFGIDGTHTYAEEGSYSASVSFTYQSTLFSCPAGTQTATFQATVHDAALSASGVDSSGAARRPLSAVVAHLQDANPGAGVNDFSARIDWGDGSTTMGTVAAAAGGGFDVTSAHTYGAVGSYHVTAAITDGGGSAATADSTAQVAATASQPPSASVSTPADGASYALGQTVIASYSCSAGGDGGTLKPGAAGCSGPVANGAAVDTSTAGAHTFEVIATDTDGQVATALAHYTVTGSSSSAPRIVKIAPIGSPATGAQIVLAASVNGPATAIKWNLTGDAKPEITCSGAQTAVTFRASAGTHSVSAVAIGPGGPGPALDTSVTVGPSASLSAAQRRIAGRVRGALARKAPVYACAAPGDFKLVRAGHSPTNLTLSDQAQTQNCATPRTVVEGGLQFEGCLKQVTTFAQIPKAELGVWYPATKSLGIPGSEVAAIPFNNGRGVDKVRDLVVNLPDVYITYGKLKVNGLTLNPGAGAAIVIAPQMNAIVSSDAGMSVGTLALNAARSFDMNLNPSAGQIPLGSFARAAGGLADIAGFALGGNVKVALDDSGGTFGLTIRVHLALPDWLQVGGVSVQGDVTLRATNDEGLVIDNLRIGPIDAEIAGLGIDSLQLDYARANQEWAGQGRACIIDGACLDMIPPNGGVVIRNGSLVRVGASLDFPPPGIELFAGVALNRIGFGVGLDPTRLLANAKLTAEGILVIDGHLVLAFPSAASPFILDHSEVDVPGHPPAFPPDFYNRRYTQTTFAIAADASIDLPIAGPTVLGGAYLLYEYPGYVGFGGGIGAHFAGIIDLTGRVDGEFNFANGRFSLKGDVHVCVADVICAGAIAAISDLGAGGCVHIGTFLGDINVGGGLGFRPFHIYFWPFDGCRWSPFVDTHVHPAYDARAATAGAPIPVRIKRGAASRAIELDGVGGAPEVRVQTPGGKILQSPSVSGLALSPAIRIMRSEKLHTTVVGLVHPAPGTYTIQLLPGSPAIKKMSQAEDQPKARISASVRGTGARRTLSYTVGRRIDQRVRFTEHIAHSGSRIIGTISGGGRGRLSFTPAPGNDRRTIIAQFELDGLPAETITIASFKPPSPQLGKPAHLKVSRRGHTLGISWAAVAGATSYTVVARLGSGERVVRTHRRTISIRRVARSDGGLISVLAVATMRHGKPTVRRISGIGHASTRLGTLPGPPRK